MSSDVLALFNNSLRYRGVTTVTDMNDLIESGIYYHTNTITTNKPSVSITYTYIFVIEFIHNYRIQFLFKPINGYLFFREYSGAQPTWSAWKTLSAS